MARIGLEKPKYSVINMTETGDGKVIETYAPAKTFAQAISATPSINTSRVKLYADNGVARMASVFVSGSIAFVADEIEHGVEKDIVGAKLDEETGAIINSGEDTATYVRFGFVVSRINRAGKKQYAAIIYPKVMFDVPAEDYETQGETIVFKTTTVTGEIMRNGADQWRIRSGWKDAKEEAEAFLVENIAPQVAQTEQEASPTEE